MREKKIYLTTLNICILKIPKADREKILVSYNRDKSPQYIGLQKLEERVNNHTEK